MTSVRPSGLDDLTEITALQRRYDVAWFGAPEHDEDEVREWIELGDSLCAVKSDGRLVGVGNAWRTGSSLVVEPGPNAAAASERLVDWLAGTAPPDTDLLDRDEVLRAALTAAGWSYAHSSFELLRPVADDWTRPVPSAPDGVELRPLEPGEESRLHDLIYRDARWADVPGHHARDLDEWQRIFLRERSPAERPLVAVRDGRFVGAALLRLFSDGTGWIAQLAVAEDERGAGLGRTLLLTGLDRLAGAGARRLGLDVIATNRAALRLYLDVGLVIEREWQTLTRPGQPCELPAQSGGSA